MHAIVWFVKNPNDGEIKPALIENGILANSDGDHFPCGPSSRSLGALMSGFKAATTKRTNQFRHSPGRPVWQRNYYEHIVRSEEELNRIRGYIRGNPFRWENDRENPENHK